MLKTQLMPMIVLRGLVVFPNNIMQFDIGRSKSLLAVKRAMDDGQKVFLLTQRDATVEDPSADELYSVGCIARIRQTLKLPGENLRVLVEGVRRATVKDILTDVPYFFVEADPAEDKQSRVSAIRREALVRSVKDVFDEYVSLSGGRVSQEVALAVAADNDEGHLADYIGSNLPMPYEQKQILLDEFNPVKRLDLLNSMLTHECSILKIDADIHHKVQQNLEDNQREYYLREQIRVIGDELGDDVDEIEEYKAKIESLSAPDDVKQKLNREVDKLAKMPQGSHEATVINGYLDACIALPWGTYSRDSISVKRAKALLDKKHYGMKEVKERIIELLAVRKLAPDISGQILCLVGPPGVGKTSIASCVAECMGRRFERVSLGGVKDESEIRGHRRTYIGSMSGRIMAAVSHAGTSNPVILLDEIDKIGSDFKGDCSAALLEALDPEQNATFRDHYIDLPFDLSRVLFITTANDESAIPEPLRDRMEVIRLAGYTREDKFRIARDHLVAKQLERHGMTPSVCRIGDDAIYTLIDHYTREAGVRTLERNIASLCRKSAVRIASGEAKRVSVSAASVEQMLGKRKFLVDTVENHSDEIGAVNGLAWTSVGGEIMRLEVSVLDGSGKVELTGSLGDVMQESAKTAIGYIRSMAGQLGIDASFYKNKDIHVHATESAVPKDGPSAGITIATALVSCLCGRAVRRDVAMTGEITLHGHVLPIGGLKEKSMAAYRAGVTTVIIPKENERDLDDIDAEVRRAIRFIPVSEARSVFDIALCDAEMSDGEQADGPKMPPVHASGAVNAIGGCDR